jgi:hypothetical protein
MAYMREKKVNRNSIKGRHTFNFLYKDFKYDILNIFKGTKGNYP